LGGHSLLAVRVITRVRQALGVEVPLGDLFAKPVLLNFAEKVIDTQLDQFHSTDLAQLRSLM
jgi:hypothetical protein